MAARLAAVGHDVVVCEAAAATGGKLGLIEHESPVGTFRFDTGPSLVTMPGVFHDLFAATGGWPDDLELTPLDPIASYRFADGATFDASNDLDVHCTRLDTALGAGAGDDWRAFMARARQVWDASREPFLERAFGGAPQLAKLALTQPRDIAAIAPGRSLRALGRRYLRDPRLRMVLDRYATYTGSDPRRAPAALAAVPFVEQAFGGWYVTGGLHRLGTAIHDRALERGATILLGTPVTRITTSAGRADGVDLAGGGHLPADVVIANADATHVYNDLISCPTAQRRLAKATPSLSGFVLMLALEGRTPDLAHHNVLFPDDYDAEFDAVFGANARPVADPTLYISSPTDPAVAPAGHEAWFVLVNAARHGSGANALQWDAATTSSYGDHLLDRLAARGLDVRDRLLWSSCLSPADLEARTGAVGGAIYGTSSNGPSAAFLRPANRSPVEGLFLVGGSSHPGGGLPLVTLSAKIVAGLVGAA